MTPFSPTSPFELTPRTEALDLLRVLLSFDTSQHGSDHEACASWIATHLTTLGFNVEFHGREDGHPLVVARREPRGLAGHVVLYGHYDIHAARGSWSGRDVTAELTVRGGRLYAPGIADNKGPLAARMDAIAALESAPALTWLIQGEEECGSEVARGRFPTLFREMEPTPTLWLDETGYHDHTDGTLRLLARIVRNGVSESPDRALAQLLRSLGELADSWNLPVRHECRGLDKRAVPGGCPFHAALPDGARHLAVGVNDSLARIHRRDESLPTWTFPLHVEQLARVFRWADAAARGAL